MAEQAKKSGFRRKLIVAAAVLAAASVLLLSFIGVFRITEVTVVGNDYYTNEEIAEFIVGEGYQRNTFYLYFRYKYKKKPKINFVDDF